MLVKFLPEQVSDNWNLFAPYIAQSLPPIMNRSLEGMTNILRSLLFGDLELWIYYDLEQGEDAAIYILTTVTRLDRVSLDKSLLIYSFTAIRNIQPRHWTEGLRTLRKYASSQNCSNILAYTSNEEMAKFLESNYNANIDQTLIRLEV